MNDDESQSNSGNMVQMPDSVWNQVEPTLEELFPSKKRGRRRKNLRLILEGILYQKKTHCQWNALPSQYGSGSTVHRWYLRLCDTNAIERIWSLIGVQLGSVPVPTRQRFHR